MRVLYLSLGFLFAQEIRNVRSPDPGPGIPDSPRLHCGNSSPQSPSASSSIPCDRTKVKSGAADAHSACQNECLALTSEISTFYNAYPDYKIIAYLYNNCGMVTEGHCSTATYFPICWCHTPKESKVQRSMTLFKCHIGTEIMRKFTNARTNRESNTLATSVKNRINGQEIGRKAATEAVAMYQFPGPRPSTRPRTRRGSRPGTARQDDRRVDLSAGPSSAGSSSGGPSSPQDFNSRPDGQPEGSKKKFHKGSSHGRVRYSIVSK